MPVAILAAAVTSCLTAVASQAQTLAAADQQPIHVVAHASAQSDRAASLTFELSNGTALTIALAGGRVTIDGSEVATYQPGSAFEASWWALVRQAGRLDAAEMLQAAQGWGVDGLTATEADAATRIDVALARVEAPQDIPPATEPPTATPPAPIAIPRLDSSLLDLGNVDAARALSEQLRSRMDELRIRLEDGRLALGQARVTVGDLTVPKGQLIEGSVAVLRGDVAVEGHVTGDVVALDGNVVLRSGGIVGGDVLAMNGEVIRAGGVVHGSVRNISETGDLVDRQVGATPRNTVSARSILGGIGTHLTGLAASFVALAGIGFGLLTVAPRQLEVVADTVRGSFWRSFLTGVLAQSLVVPAFAVLTIGLMLSVIGIALLPFAFLALVALTIMAVLGGYVAAARSAGELYVRKRMALGHAVKGGLSFRYIVHGLIILLAVWAPASVLGWVPVAGAIVTVTAVLFTWMMASAGLGATILSRAGIRGTFTRRFDEALSDQYLYYTPQATPVVRADGSPQPPRP